MQSAITKVQNLMDKFHVLHKEYDSSEESFNTPYYELEDENSPSAIIFDEIDSILIENEEEALKYFESCNTLDFFLIICQSSICFSSKNFYKKMKKLWSEKFHDHNSDTYYQVMEYLSLDEAQCNH